MAQLQPKQSVIFNSSCHLIRSTARVTIKKKKKKEQEQQNQQQQQNPKYISSAPDQILT